MTHRHDAVEAPVLQVLESLSIAVAIHRHPPFHTVEHSKALRGAMPGAHVKHLFLRDRKSGIWLVTVDEDRRVDLKALRHVLGATGSLSFGSPELLHDVLGVEPGAVSPLAVINDRQRRVGSVLDRALLRAAVVNVHPLHNQATVALAPDALLRFLDACEHPPRILELDAP